jgi:hypothetical protein
MNRLCRNEGPPIVQTQTKARDSGKALEMDLEGVWVKALAEDSVKG